VTLRQKYQRFGFKAARAKLLRQCQSGFRVSKCRSEIHQRMPAEECRMMTNHLRAPMSHSCRSRNCRVGYRERASGVAGKPLCEGHHRAVRHFNAAEAVPLA
jgi:hypothetical protein